MIGQCIDLVLNNILLVTLGGKENQLLITVYIEIIVVVVVLYLSKHFKEANEVALGYCNAWQYWQSNLILTNLR